MLPAGPPAKRVRRERPPPRLFLGIGAVCLAVNHLSVAFGNGLSAEALVAGCWLVLMGGWSQFAGRTFDAVWRWANPAGWRVIGFMLLTLVASVAAAEGVARLVYGQPLLG
jgi:hypothetical protein